MILKTLHFILLSIKTQLKSQSPFAIGIEGARAALALRSGYSFVFRSDLKIMSSVK